MLKNQAGARPTPRAEETRRRILESALELLRDRGFDETSTREIARRAGIANGAAYYYFSSKEEMVLAFYLDTQRQMYEKTRARFSQTRDLRTRLQAVLELKLAELLPFRTLLGVLFRTAADPQSPISPFGQAAAPVRERSIRLFDEALQGCQTRMPEDLRTHLPRLLWLYHMGLILFWIHDRSAGQRRTRVLLHRSLDLIVRGIGLARFRIMSPFRKAALSLLAELEQDPDRADSA